MRTVCVEDAVGMVLCHDITQIVPGSSKGRAFKKGCIIQQVDVPKLLDLGKERIYVQDIPAGTIHEDDAAKRIAAAAVGSGLRLSEPVEGKVELIARRSGLLSVNVDALCRINAIEDVMFATLHTRQQVVTDQPVAGTRIIPLFTDERRIQTVERICRERFPIIQVKSFTSLKVGIVTTGSEIYHGRIEDKFGSVLREKFGALGSEVIDQVFVSDDIAMTVDAIKGLIRTGAQLIAVTGGMSVDPDDQTPASIRAAGGKVIEVLADELNLPAESIDIRNGYVVFDREDVDFSAMRTRYIKEHRGWTDNPDSEKLTFKEASRIAYLAKGTIVGTGKYKPQFLGGKYKGAAVGISPAYGCSAQVVEVKVDLETGQVVIEKVTDAHDCGKAINRTSVEGQMQGSVSMGIGEAMHEEVKFDDKGHVINNDLAEYKMVTALDMPPVEAIVVETNEPNGPFGAKEVGEGAIMPTIPAVLNAIYDATGVRIHELPLTPQRVYEALRQRRSEKS